MSTTTLNSAKAWSPDEDVFAPADIVPEALIMRTSTIAGSVDGDAPSVRVAYVTDAESAGFVAEGAAIPDDAPDLDEVVITTKKISRLVTVSSEQFGQEGTSSNIAQSVARDLVRKADNAYLGENTAPLIGLLHAAGVVNGGEVNGNLDVLIDLFAELELAGATPGAIILDPVSWAQIRKLKVGGSNTNESLVGAGTTDATPMLLSVPVLRSRFIPQASGIVVDRASIVSAVGPVKVAQSEHAAFANDSIVMRATWRIGWKFTRPERIGRFTVNSGGS